MKFRKQFLIKSNLPLGCTGGCLPWWCTDLWWLDECEDEDLCSPPVDGCCERELPELAVCSAGCNGPLRLVLLNK